MRGAIAAIGDGAAQLGRYVADVGRDVLAVRFTGDRARFAAATALSVVVAVTLSQWARLDDPWWAGISGMMASQATRPASVARVILRIAGTAAGAGLGYVAVGLFAYDHVALCLFLFTAATIGLLGMSVSPYGYAWMLGGLTANLVVMMSMLDPTQAPYIVFDRVAQVALGCFAALVVALTLRPDGGTATTAAVPGWRDLLGARWPAVEHAVRSGIAIMLMPVIWNFLDLPSLSQMAITATAVMAVPIPAGGHADLLHVVAERAVLRTMGCLLGGVFGLLWIGLPLTSYPIWLAVLFGGVWIFAYIQSSPAAISYVGVQAALVVIITLVQGAGPPNTLLPGIERLAGIIGGLAVLAIVNFALWPSLEPPSDDVRKAT